MSAHTCEVCGGIHENLELEFVAPEPDAWGDADWRQRHAGSLTEDFCVLPQQDGPTRYFRAAELRIPIRDGGSNGDIGGRAVIWSVWAEVGTAQKPDALEDLQATLATEILGDESSVGLSGRLVVRPEFDYPQLQLHAWQQHPLAEDQARGIRLHDAVPLGAYVRHGGAPDELRLDVWEGPVETPCGDCGGLRWYYDGAAYDATGTVAVFVAFLYDHPGAREVRVDVTFGSWDEEAVPGASATPAAPLDHVTFGARLLVGDPPELVPGGELAPDDPMIGRRLTVEEQQMHELLPQFWEVYGLVLGVDAVGAHLTGRPAPRLFAW